MNINKFADNQFLKMKESVPQDKELNQLLEKTFTSDFRKGYITENNFLLPERYSLVKNDIEELEVFDTDVWICGYQKTGTTWLTEIVWMILNDFDYQRATDVSVDKVVFLDLNALFDVEKHFLSKFNPGDAVTRAKMQKHPRTIKSHLPFPLLPKQIFEKLKKPKIFYTARNPLDVCVSYYYHCKNYDGFKGTFEEFCTLFFNDKITYGPYSSHILSFWHQRNEPNVFFLTYEEMKSDLPGVIDKIAEFLGKPLSREDNLRLQQHVSFESMSKNVSVNREDVYAYCRTAYGIELTPFMRKGVVGGYKTVMTPEQITKFKKKMSKEFEGSGLNLLDD